jgi:hypothetical protein
MPFKIFQFAKFDCGDLITVRNRIMLGSVSYPGYAFESQFLQSLEALSLSISTLGFECEKIDSSWQNLTSTKLSILKIFKIIIFHTKFQSEISGSRLRKLFAIKVFLMVLLRITKDLILLSKKDFENKHLGHFVLNEYITDKHLSIVGRFLNSESKYLLVCENDIVINESPIIFLGEVFDIAERQNESLFVNISNNSSFSKVTDYFGGELKDYADSNVWKEIDFFVNGTAIYFMNREMASTIYNFVVRHPAYRYCSIDWLFSLIGRKFNSPKSTCLIPTISYVSNGSRFKV